MGFQTEATSWWNSK